jgi:predicted transcriptional regulator of viral defense system
MKWQELQNIAKKQPVIETFMLARSPNELSKVRVQLSGWVKGGRLIQVKRGAYILSDEYAFQPADWNYIATFVHRPSYISLHYALADHGMIPEYVPNVTLVTTKRPKTMKFHKKLLIYQHVKRELFWGYEVRGEKNFPIYFAEPEKALLDLFYFTSGEISMPFIEEMRFQNMDILSQERLIKYAKKFGSQKIIIAANLLLKFLDKEKEWATL